MVVGYIIITYVFIFYYYFVYFVYLMATLAHKRDNTLKLPKLILTSLNLVLINLIDFY